MNNRMLLLLAACGTMMPLASCSTAPRETTPGAVRAAASIAEPLRRLEALAEVEAVSGPGGVPGKASLDMARLIDPGFPQAFPPGSAEFRGATRPLEDLLGEVRIAEPNTRIDPPSPEDRERAAKAYTRARASRLSGEAEVAELLMEEAVRLDPGSAVLWQELGEARMALGDRFGAADALTMAAELGAEDPRVMLTLALEAGSRSDEDGVVRWAGGAWTRGEAGSAERAVAGSMLGAALLERGDMLAGAGVLEETLGWLDATPAQAGEPADLVRLRSRRAEMQFRVGDAWVTLGQPARGASAYARGADGLARPPAQLTQRELAAWAASGRPATAAVQMIEHTRRFMGDLGPEEAGWLRGLSVEARVGPALTEALHALALDATRPPSARRQVMRVLVRGTPDPNTAVRLLGADPALARSGVLANEALRRVVPAQRLTLAAEWVGKDPASARAWGGALARLSRDPLAMARELIGAREPGRRMLGLGMATELDRADLGVGVIDAGPVPGVDPVLGAHLAGLAGRWDRVDRWLDAARSAPGTDGARRADWFMALLACQRLEEADRLCAMIDVDEGATAEDLLMAAEYALLEGDAERLVERLERAVRADRFDERAWERLIGLRSSGEPGEGGQDELVRLGRELSETRPRGPLLTLLRARELAGQGRLREVCESLFAVNERDPGRDFGSQMLAQAMQAARERGDQETAAMVLSWLERRSGEVPGSVPVALAYAQALLISGDARGSFERLDDAFARIGHPELGRGAESVLAQRLEQPDAAVTRALDRLAGAQGVNGSLERAEVGLAAQRWTVAMDAARSSVPPGEGRMSRPQLTRWYRVVFELARDAERGGSGAGGVGALIALMDDAARAGVPMPAEMVRVRLLLLARSGDLEQIRSFVAQEVLGADSGLMAVQALLGADRVPEALRLLGDVALSGEGVWEDEFAEWARLAGAYAGRAETEEMVARLDALGRTAEAAMVLFERFSPGEMPGERTPARDRADIAYIVGLIATVFERDEEAGAVYRLALEYDPGHGWAANDLGYALAERGESLEEAEALLEMAYAVLPDESSVTDSIGWVRYMTGVFADEVDADGTVVRAGAVSLLRRAATLEGGAENPTVFEHLGDALWRVGDREGAMAAWTTAEGLLRRQARTLATESQPNSRRVDRVNTQLREVRRRLSDAENGNEPRIAPVPGLDAGTRGDDAGG